MQLIQQSFQVGFGIIPNVKLTVYRCRCGEFHLKITTLMPIGPDDVLCSNIQQEAGTLIVQFDGSCHADKGVGGAGAALLELQTQGLTLLQWRALALPKCPDNIFAEAMSANLGADLLSEELVRRKFVVQQAYLQGDILPIIKHLSFAGRFRRIDSCHDHRHGPAMPCQVERADPVVPLGRRRIRWNTQAPTTGYETFVERTAKRRRASR